MTQNRSAKVGALRAWTCQLGLRELREQSRRQQFSAHRGRELETWTAAKALRALEPASLALSLAATRHAEAERADLDRLWQQRLERPLGNERAQRQYAAVEPERRLAAATRR